MPSKTVFRIDQGAALAFELVDPAAVGFDPAWQAPLGKELPTVLPSDYSTGTDGFQCQVVTGTLTSTQNSTTETLDGTWCDLPETINVAGEDTFAVALDIYQDPNRPDGLSAFLFTNRGKDAFVYIGMAPPSGTATVPPAAIGVVTLSSATIGGGRSANRAQVTFPFKAAPDVMFGTAADWIVVPGDRGTPTTGPAAAMAAAES
jgi:hypothetical protein